jgi:mannose-6-phosphate isomerase-like protein (cupin superfamily)
MALSLAEHPIHLGLGGSAVAQPAFTGVEWYEDYGNRTAADGAEGRLVAIHTFTEDWGSWERHPAGEEVVLCVAGAITLHQELPDGSTSTIDLGPNEYAINPPGVWHTADIAEEATCLFITAGLDTENRAR